MRPSWLTWETFDRVLRVAQATGVGLAALGLLMTSHQLRLAQLSESATLGLQFDQRINTGVNFQINSAIESSSHLLKTSGGKFTESQLEDYLGQYDTLYYLYRQDLINERMIYNLFAFDVALAHKNQEITGFLKKVRSDNRDLALFVGFDKLADLVESWSADSSAKKLE
ncbi:hypothetical protein [Bradyrhizobium sp. SZCCHNS2096]|uniref:hypothetical protein n=1 Tax=Bradyrhizobium sp. SZCCHNS2096 TaxID=3057309 RepID=UPI0029166850|nr:hypothetical protein [Bradyrhizobium sp. SZCCHNS2096]